MTTTYDVVIVGAGIIGLVSAFEVASAGYSVALIDDAPGKGSTYAAAGMLAPGAESSPEHDVLSKLTSEGRRRWPDFVRRVATTSSCDLALHTVGSLFVAWNHSDHLELDRYAHTARESDIALDPVSRESKGTLFESLSPRLTSGYFVRDDAFIQTDELVVALVCAARRLGVTIIEERATECTHVGEGVGVELNHGQVTARCGIIATGAATPPLSLLTRAQFKVRPVRGVTLRLQATNTAVMPMVRGIVEGRSVYVIFRQGGSIVVGASSDESPALVAEAGVVRTLLEDAERLVPELGTATFVEARVGARPAADDHLPFFVSLDESRWSWSSGHFRHGYLLAPLAAQSALAYVESLLS